MVFRALPDAGDSDHLFPASRPTLNSQPLELVRELRRVSADRCLKQFSAGEPLLANGFTFQRREGV